MKEKPHKVDIYAAGLQGNSGTTRKQFAVAMSLISAEELVKFSVF